MSETTPLFEVKGLRVAIEGKEILRGVDLTIERGQVHALMGPNGSGKSTLAYVVMGHPHYEVLEGQILYKGQDIAELDTDKRARLGIFLAFQADRWYESRKLLADLDGYFLALADDFAETRQSLERAIDAHGRSRDAAIQLINYGPEEGAGEG